MRQMKHIIRLLVLVVFSVQVKAQVNLQTGGATYSIPMFNWNDDKSRLNGMVALNYNSGNGLKVADMATNAGQGWNLIAGGVISRMQVGEPDDQPAFPGVKYPGTGQPLDEDVTKYPAGYLYATIPISNGCPNALNTYPIYSAKNTKYSPHNVTSEDKQMDYFAFQFNGKSGMFILDKTNPGNGVFIGDSKMKVTYQVDLSMVNNTTSGIRTVITSFTIQDVDGLIYKFKQHGLSKVLHAGYCGSDLSTEQNQPNFQQAGVYHQTGFDKGQTSVQVINPYIIGSWYLSEVDDPLTHRIINLYYNAPVAATNFAGLDISDNRTATKSYIVINHKKSVTVTPHLSSIAYPDGHQVNINYGSARVDMNGENAIASVDVLYNGRYLSEYQLNTTYFILNRYGTPSSAYQKSVARLCLKSVKKLGVDLKEDSPPYNFDYYTGSDAPDDFVPPPFFYAHDVFGFYNGNYSMDYNGSQLPLQNTDVSKLNFDQLRGLVYLTQYNDNPASIKTVPVYVNPKPGYAKNGLLKQIIYPTGGTLAFTYAQNKGSYSNVVYNASSSGYIGGVSVNTTSSTDGGYSNGCGNPIVTNYNYVLNDGVSSSIWGLETPVNRMSFTSHYNAENKRFKLFSCYYKFQYPGIQSQYEAISLSDFQNVMEAIAPAMDIISVVSTIMDINQIITCATAGAGAPVTAIIDVILTLANVALTCFAGDHSTDTNTTVYYNADLNVSAPLPMQFKLVEFVESGGGIGKTVQEFTSEDDYPVWVPANTNTDFSSKQRFAPWVYGLPKFTSVYDVNGNIIKQTRNVYDVTKASHLIDGCRSTTSSQSTPGIYNSVCYANTPDPAYGIYGPYIYSSTSDNTGTLFTDNTGGFWENTFGNKTDGRINRIGLWPCSAVPDHVWTGFTVPVFFPGTGVYYFGMGADNQVRVSVDGTVVKEVDMYTYSSTDASAPFRRWNLYPYYVTQGYHNVKVEGWNNGGAALFGAEVYNATANQLQTLDSTAIQSLTIFSTGDILKGKDFTTCPVYANNLTSPLLSCKCQVNYSASQRNDRWSDPANYAAANATTYTNASTGNLGVNFYGYYSGRMELDTTYERVYNPSDATKYTETVTAYQYNNGSTNYDVNQVTTIQSNGDINYKKIQYNSDFQNTGTALDSLYNNNIFSVPVANNTTVTKAAGGGTSLLNEHVTEFTQTANGDIKPAKTLEQRFSQPAASYVTYQGPGNGANPAYKQTQTITYDGNSNVTGVQDEGGHVVANIYDYNDKYVVGSVINANPVLDHPAYTSFETTGLGGWTLIGGSGITSSAAVTGINAFVLSSNSLSASLNTAKSYIVSLWSNSSRISVSNATLVKSAPAINGFTYYEYTIAQGNSSVIISGSATIDELRLYPQNARMRTVTYDPLIGKTSECDENNRVIYYEYDNLGRLKFIKDEHRQVMKMYEYNNVSPAKQNGCPSVYYSHAITEYFTKSDCGNGYLGTDVPYTIPAAKYSSTLSQQHADRQAEKELLTSGQTNANTSGACRLIYYNQAVSITDTTQSCAAGAVPGTVTYTVPANRYWSVVSQAAADSMATDELNANAQAYANDPANAACTVSTAPVWDSGDPVSTMCQNGYEWVQMTDINPNSSTYNATTWIKTGQVGSCCSAQSTPGTYNGVCYVNTPYPTYGIYGPYLYSSTSDNVGTSFTDNTGGFWENTFGNTTDGRLNRVGIWPCSGVPDHTWTGFTAPVFFPNTGVYYLGMGGDNQVRISIDGVLAKEVDQFTYNNTDETIVFKRWNLYPYYVTQGYHNVTVEGWNDAGPALFGAEIYNATANQLQTLDSTAIKSLTIFSTGDILKGMCTSPTGRIPHQSLPAEKRVYESMVINRNENIRRRPVNGGLAMKYDPNTK